VPTGIPEEDFQGVDKAVERKKSQWLLQFPQMRGKKVLLYVGRVGQEKNVDFLIDVLERVRKTVPEAMLVLAGNGPYLNTFKANVAARGLSESVLCLGYVNRGDLKHLYAGRRVHLRLGDRNPGLGYHRSHDVRNPRRGHWQDGDEGSHGRRPRRFMVDEDVCFRTP